MAKMSRRFMLIVTLLAAAPVVGRCDARLLLDVEGSTRSVTLADLRRSLKVETCSTTNPVYQKKMTYEGFWLDDLLPVLRLPLDQDIGFEAVDGYGTSLSQQEIGRHRWLLAFGEKGGGWTPLPRHKKGVTPGPWYLVGASPESFKEVEWPYGIVKIKMTKDF